MLTCPTCRSADTQPLLGDDYLCTACGRRARCVDNRLVPFTLADSRPAPEPTRGEP